MSKFVEDIQWLYFLIFSVVTNVRIKASDGQIQLLHDSYVGFFSCLQMPYSTHESRSLRGNEEDLKADDKSNLSHFRDLALNLIKS